MSDMIIDPTEGWELARLLASGWESPKEGELSPLARWHQKAGAMGLAWAGAELSGEALRAWAKAEKEGLAPRGPKGESIAHWIGFNGGVKELAVFATEGLEPLDGLGRNPLHWMARCPVGAHEREPAQALKGWLARVDDRGFCPRGLALCSGSSSVLESWAQAWPPEEDQRLALGAAGSMSAATAALALKWKSGAAPQAIESSASSRSMPKGLERSGWTKELWARLRAKLREGAGAAIDEAQELKAEAKERKESESPERKERSARRAL